MDSSINQAGERPVTPIDDSIRAVGGGSRQQPAAAGIGALGEIPVAIASENHISLGAEHEERGVNRPSSFCDHVTSAATRAGTVAHTLWNSEPPFIVSISRERLITEKRYWEGKRNIPFYAEELGLRPQLDAIIRACDDIIALPSYGYHLTAEQKYHNFTVALDNYQTAKDAAYALFYAQQDARNPIPIPIPDEKGAYRISQEQAAVRGIHQAHDAVRGRGRPIEVPEATLIDPVEAEEITNEADVDSNTPHAEGSTIDPELMNIAASPVAEASVVNDQVGLEESK